MTKAHERKQHITTMKREKKEELVVTIKIRVDVCPGPAVKILCGEINYTIY